MFATLGSRINVQRSFAPAAHYLKRPIRLFRTYDRNNLRPDLIAGLTVAVILLPQSIAFALIAELPPQMGLYAAIVGAVIGAFWGSSDQIHTGPTNAISLLVFSSLSAVVAVGTSDYIVAAGIMAVMVGLFQLVMGLARLGMLVNFVSHSVIVGFATGAGILIGIKQVSPLLGISFEAENILETLTGIVTSLPDLHPQTAAIGIGTMLLIVILRRINNRLPTALIAMVVASLAIFIFKLDKQGVAVIGQLPSGFPPLAELPLLDFELIGRLATGALAVGAIGLVESTAISRSVSAQTGQRLDSNQEFVGQGMANLFAGLFSGYASAGSFSRTAVNFKGGARSPMSAIFSGLFVLIATFILGPLTAFLPIAALAGVLIVTAYGMIDQEELRRIWHSHPGDAAIMVLTLAGTLFLHIETAVLIGIVVSLVLYILRTSTPQVHAVLPDDRFRHFAHRPEKRPCPQLAIIEILGDLYFGAVNHVEESILDYADKHPQQRFLLLRMHHVNSCDFSGIHMLENVVRKYRDRGGEVFLVRTNLRVYQMACSSGFDKFLGEHRFLDEDEAISHLFYQHLDPAVCIYECPLRVFRECQNLPKHIAVANIPLESEISAEHILTLAPDKLWAWLHPVKNGTVAPPSPKPMVVDVREPREYSQGHIAEAELIPLSKILSDDVKLPADRQIILVCRTGRRSKRAAAALHQIGCMNVQILQGGMQAWEAAGLLEAVDQYG